MKIQTSDGNVFDVPEENIESFLNEYDTAKKFEEANKQMSAIDKVLHPGGKYGFVRNVLRGIPGAARIEGAVRSIPSGFKDYSKIRDWANKSADEYAAVNPDKALAGTIGGALVPSTLATILSFGLGSGAGAANTARAAGTVANAVNTAKKAKLYERALRGAAGNAGLGALYGFMDEPSESLTDRLETALGSGVIGGTIGGSMPYGLSLTGKIGNTTKRIFQGFSEESLPAQQVEKYILDSGILQNTPESALTADILRKASASGALDIYKPAYNMNATLEASSNMWKPKVLTNITSPNESTAKEIIIAGRTPQMEEAAQRYANFLESVKDTPGQGLVANEFMKRNPVAKKILSVEPSLENVPVGSFEWFKNAESTLRNSLPEKVDSDRLVGRRASIMRSIDDISKTREMIHPGTSQANLDYAIGEAWEKEGAKVLEDRLKFIANMPTETDPSLSSRDILRLGFKPFQRGRARELIKNGELYLRPSAKSQILMQVLGDDITNALRLE